MKIEENKEIDLLFAFLLRINSHVFAWLQSYDQFENMAACI